MGVLRYNALFRVKSDIFLKEFKLTISLSNLYVENNQSIDFLISNIK